MLIQSTLLCVNQVALGKTVHKVHKVNMICDKIQTWMGLTTFFIGYHRSHTHSIINRYNNSFSYRHIIIDDEGRRPRSAQHLLVKVCVVQHRE